MRLGRFSLVIESSSNGAGGVRAELMRLRGAKFNTRLKGVHLRACVAKIIPNHISQPIIPRVTAHHRGPTKRIEHAVGLFSHRDSLLFAPNLFQKRGTMRRV